MENQQVTQACAECNGPLVVIVVPVYNEVECLAKLYDAIAAALTGFAWSAWFVDDGSTDGSADLLDDMAGMHGNMRVLHLSRNFGHMAALTAGIDHAQGDVVVTMDADLQHPPELIPRMIEMWQGGADIVQTVREATAGAGVVKRWSSRAFYAVFRAAAGIDLESNAADFRLMDASVVEALKSFRERKRFIRGLVWWMGYRRELLRYEACNRLHGETKYTLRKMLYFAADALVSFTAMPLRMIFTTGLVTLVGSVVYGSYALLVYLFTNKTQPGWTSMLLVMLVFSSMQLLSLGVIGHYVATAYDEIKARPIYIVRQPARRRQQHVQPSRETAGA